MMSAITYLLDSLVSLASFRYSSLNSLLNLAALRYSLLSEYFYPTFCQLFLLEYLMLQDSVDCFVSGTLMISLLPSVLV
jgi:hypothetical protein